MVLMLGLADRMRAWHAHMTLSLDQVYCLLDPEDFVADSGEIGD